MAIYYKSVIDQLLLCASAYMDPAASKSSLTMLGVCLHFRINIFQCFIVSFLTLRPSSVHSLYFNITNFNAENANSMAYEGDASPVNGSIELDTITLSFRAGRAIYGQPLRLWDSSTGTLTDFSTRFSFTIDRKNNNSIYSDGFAFYMSALGYPIPPNSAGGYLGLFNVTTANGVPQNHVVAVEFDTFSNEYDPSMQHVGINNNSITSLAYKLFDIDRNTGEQGHALITYDASSKTLSVYWSFNKSASEFMPNGSLSYQIHLMKVLPEWVNFGFSAATGSYQARHTIHSWEFTSTLNSTYPDQVDRKNKGVVAVLAVTCSIILVLAGVSVCWLIMGRKRRTKKFRSRQTVIFDLDRASIPRRFYYRELVEATNGFADDRRLGRGGSGQVYKGMLSDLGRVVAVKRIFADFEDSEKIFTNEVKIISRLIHRNLVQFTGWCHEQGELLLVYDYMPNGSLDTHLFGNRKSLAWNVRYKIALGVATALHYLHEDAEQTVLHRDIKSANVLLDTDFSTKLGDFGMAKLVDPRLRTQRTGVVGTYGYLAPEYMNGGRATKESDMYSFGVVALEIACGKRTYQDGEYHVPLVNWVWGLHVEGNILNGADEGLNGDFDVNEMTCLLTVGLWCTHPNDKERPRAAQVIKVLLLEAPLPVLPHNVHDPPSRPAHPQSNSFPSQPITASLVNSGR